MLAPVPEALVDRPRLDTADITSTIVGFTCCRQAEEIGLLIITQLALKMQRRSAVLGGRDEDYGLIAINARRWAALNKRAVMRTPLTMDDYLSAKMLCDPLRLLDCDYPAEQSVRNPSAGWLDTGLRGARHLLRRCLEEGMTVVLKRKFHHEKIKLRYRLLRLSPHTSSFHPRIFGMEAYLALSAKEYVPQPYGGDMVLFIAEESLEMQPRFGAGWARSVLGRLEMLEIPGTHQKILNLPHVTRLAQEFQKRIHPQQAALNDALAACSMN